MPKYKYNRRFAYIMQAVWQLFILSYSYCVKSFYKIHTIEMIGIKNN